MRAEPGWHHVEGDPPGTVRAWNGREWTTGPQVVTHNPVGGLGRVAVAALVAVVVLEVLVMLVRLRDLDWLLDFRLAIDSGALVAVIPAEALPWEYAVITVAYPFVSIATGVVFLVWFHRCYSNLPAIRGAAMYTPRQAVAAWLVPLVDLWYPYKMTRELRPFTGGGDLLTDDSARRIRPVPTWLLVCWWALFLGAGSVAAIVWLWEPSSLDGSIRWNTLDIVRGAASIVAAATAIVIVRRISAYQDSRLVGP